MKKVLNTIFIGLLALGLMGIILGISVGLYRNDVLARMQAAEESELDPDGQDFLEQYQDGDADPDAPQIEKNTLFELLLWGNLHTILLAVGTLLTIISVTIFLISIRSSMQKNIR